MIQHASAMPLTVLIGGTMEYNLGMMSARPEGPRVGWGTWRGGSEPSPCGLLQGLRDIVTSTGLGRGPIKFLMWCIFGT